MMQKSAPALAALALALATACGGNPWVVDSYQAPEADVASRHSFAWRTGEVGAPLVLRPQVAADVQARIRAVVTQELLKKGYVEATDPAGADMTVSFQVTGAPRAVESEQPRFGAPSPNQVLTPGSVPPRPASEPPREMLVRDGTVVVLAEDPASGRLMWRGLVRAEIRTSSLDRTVDKVVDIARHIAQGFPARGPAP
jgi:hypothetical protein